VKDGVWQSGVKNGVSKMVCDKVVCERWWVTKMVGKRGGRERDTESKTRTPHKDVGKKQPS